MNGPRRLGLALAVTGALATLLCGSGFAKSAPPRLAGSFATTLTLLESSDAGQQPGSSSQRSWLFTPVCGKGACDVTVEVKSGAYFRTIHLTRKGSSYTGTATNDAPWFCATQTLPAGATETDQVAVRITGSAKKSGALLATRVTGTVIFDIVGKPDTLQMAGCNFPASHTEYNVDGSLAKQKPGPRLEGLWTLNWQVTGGVFSDSINAPVGSKGQVRWNFVPICAKGACDVLVTSSDTVPVTVVYLTYVGDGTYRGVANFATHVECDGTDIYPGYLGSTQFEFHAAGTTRATSLTGTAALVQDTTPTVNTAPGCNKGHIEANWSYTSATE